jgi:hypothetical protein
MATRVREMPIGLTIARLFAAILAISSYSAYGQEAKSPVEALVNPFGDMWSLARPNPDARLMGTFLCHRVLPRPFRTISPEQKQFVKRLGAPLYVSECTDLLVPPDQAPKTLNAGAVKQWISEFKQRRPDAKYIGYYSISTYSVGAPAFRELYDAHRSWFVREAKSLDPQSGFVRTKKGGLILDVTNTDFQNFIAKRADQSMQAYGMDGFLADEVYDQIERLTASPDVAPSVRRGWAGGWINMLARLQQSAGPDRLVLPNMPRKAPTFVKAALQVAAGAFVEDPLGPLSLDLAKSGALARFLDMVASAERLNKYLIMFVNTNVNGTNVQTTNATQEQRFARYYFAAHLIFTSGRKSLMAYYTPTQLGPQFRSDVFFRDWNLHVGHPVEAFQVPANGIYRRRYDKADIYLNNSARAYEIALDKPRFTPDGERISHYELAPKSGILLFSEQPQ